MCMLILQTESTSKSRRFETRQVEWNVRSNQCRYCKHPPLEGSTTR